MNKSLPLLNRTGQPPLTRKRRTAELSAEKRPKKASFLGHNYAHAEERTLIFCRQTREIDTRGENTAIQDIGNG